MARKTFTISLISLRIHVWIVLLVLLKVEI